jgi:hypothetical protein
VGSAGTQVTKVIVAVHGVGDQYSFATIQSVVNQFCSFYQEPAAVPLGNFHKKGQTPFCLRPPYPDDPFGHLAFAEVYWAKIPRTVVDDKHTLEEAKSWANTIVERLRMRWRTKGRKGGCREEDFRLLKQVLTEMIQTIAVLERICFLADRAGLFTFDLKGLLNDYLGDVQIVTEFDDQRDKIIQQFGEVMVEVNKACEDADIYIVAHSEGTVVALLGLLNAYRAAPAPRWAGKVRGLMTLGSPIDKHLVLWPDLFTDQPPVSKPPSRIEWRNYYDHGDPIGFSLDDARHWIREKKWQEVFDFTDVHDVGFARYPFPGKAHVDYWTDDDLFHHFISTVVNAPAGPTASAPAGDSFAAPKSKWRYQLLSYILPYVGVTLLVVVAAFILFKAIIVAMPPAGDLYSGWRTVAKEVAVTALFISGLTVAARIPRLTRSFFWRGVAWAIGTVSAGAYLWSVDAGLLFQGVGLSLSDPLGSLVLAILLVALVSSVSVLRPSWGMAPLILMGIVAIVGKLACGLPSAGCPESVGPLWPVLVAAVVFFYLWWLAALLFDLVFVWHLYIRHAMLLQRLDEVLGGTRDKKAPCDRKKSAPSSTDAPQVSR